MTTKVKNKRTTKKGIIVKLYRDNFIDGRVFWNLFGSRFRKSEMEQIDKTFRERKDITERS